MNETEFKNKIQNIEDERKSCVKLNLSLLTECKDNKKFLDMNYSDLYFYIACIQTSVIFLSTFSAFMQALGSNIYIPDDVQFLIALIISTYISLSLSLSKFFKLDEKKENVHNLREKFAELHNKIRYRLDTLKPWKTEGYVNKSNIKEKTDIWKSEKELTFIDYFKFIEEKEKLFMEFEKLIDSKLRNKYAILNKMEEEQYKKEDDKINIKVTDDKNI